jgi:hypothetical protein
MSRRAYLILLCVPLFAQDPRRIMQEAQKRGRSASEHYEGALEVTGARNQTSVKRWIFDRLGAFGDSRTLLRFTAPPEIKGVALLIVNHPDRSSDQWMWTPALGRERRIALQDRRTRFFGTDFSFEDLEERDANQYDYKLLGEENFDGAKCWKIASHPKQTKSSQYTSAIVWVRQDNYQIIQIENYAKDKLARRIKYGNGRIEVYDAERNSRTALKLDKLSFNTSLKPEDFTVEALRKLGVR